MGWSGARSSGQCGGESGGAPGGEEPVNHQTAGGGHIHLPIDDAGRGELDVSGHGRVPGAVLATGVKFLG